MEILLPGGDTIPLRRPSGTFGLWTDEPGARIVGAVEGSTCALCGNPIEAGEAWMVSDDDGARRVAHAGCAYRDEPSAQSHAAWRPGEAEVVT
jgi:hypothetical protein